MAKSTTSAHLQKELEAGGDQFKSRSDTEVILAAYASGARGARRDSEGMFAFALWDARRQRLLLARDPMGVKPLYYHQSKRRIYFCFGGSNASADRTGAAKGGSDRGFELPHVRFRV